jgi:hypothetical protein
MHYKITGFPCPHELMTVMFCDEKCPRSGHGSIFLYCPVFSKEEAKQRKIEFWTAFGIYMRQHVPLYGTKQKWVNYHTGVKGIFFRMEVDTKSARVSITLEQADAGIRELFFDQWLEMRTYLEAETNAEWQWDPIHYLDDGRCISRIYRELENVNIFEKEDWQRIFAFLESCIVPLDSVWADCNEVFKDLAD